MPKLTDERDSWSLVQSLAKFDEIMFRTLFMYFTSYAYRRTCISWERYMCVCQLLYTAQYLLESIYLWGTAGAVRKCWWGKHVLWHGSKRSQHSLCSARCSVKMDRYIFRLGACFPICNWNLYIMLIAKSQNILFSWVNMKDKICHHDIWLSSKLAPNWCMYQQQKDYSHWY